MSIDMWPQNALSFLSFPATSKMCPYPKYMYPKWKKRARLLLILERKSVVDMSRLKENNLPWWIIHNILTSENTGGLILLTAKSLQAVRKAKYKKDHTEMQTYKE